MVASQIFKGKNIHCQHCSHLIFSCSDRIGSCEMVFLAISRNALIIPDGWAGWILMLVGVISFATSSGMFNCCLCVSVYARTKGQCSNFWWRRPNRTFDLRTIVRQSAGKPVQRKFSSSTNIATNTGYIIQKFCSKWVFLSRWLSGKLSYGSTISRKFVKVLGWRLWQKKWRFAKRVRPVLLHCKIFFFWKWKESAVFKISVTSRSFTIFSK